MAKVNNKYAFDLYVNKEGYQNCLGTIIFEADHFMDSNELIEKIFKEKIILNIFDGAKHIFLEEYWGVKGICVYVNDAMYYIFKVANIRKI